MHSRRCFMSGEYCSKQLNVEREKARMYKSNSITAFVIMNFSDMSDIVYRWRIEPFIKRLSNYLYFDGDKKRLFCSKEKLPEGKHIKDIQVVRSDSSPASNYVICSRICQQMQIADLIIVDVSSQNANVFYELGMAVALGKMILPICYSESYYRMEDPEKAKDCREYEDKFGHYIGRFPWRKDLYEYYGIRYKSDKSNTKYVPLDIIKEGSFFPDIKYTKFPYHETYKDGITFGEKIYKTLSKGYNDGNIKSNTLVVYTMDSFLNENEAGLCIVNYYHKIVARMRQEQCFCGDRVGVLVQANKIKEPEKDARKKTDLVYDVGEIIQIGTNEATYKATQNKIPSPDEEKRSSSKDETDDSKKFSDELASFIKGYTGNRAMRVYPDNPVFVDRLKKLFQDDIFEQVKKEDNANNECKCYDGNALCLYHIMLRTLRYTNEIVVEITGNNLQSLFWLGAAHGSDVQAISVIYKDSDRTSEASGKVINIDRKQTRFVFDVAGLWTAVLRENNSDRFYKQLELVQSSIERRAKLMLPESVLSMKNDMQDEDKRSEAQRKRRKEERESETKLALESYYRDRFWSPMLSYNQLDIYVSQRSRRDENGDPRMDMYKWDFDAISELTNYLSKRKIIGKYKLCALGPNTESEKQKNGIRSNFISVGSLSKPLGKQLSAYIWEKCGGRESNTIRFFDKSDVCEKTNDAQKNDLPVCTVGTPSEIAQLVLWRETAGNPHEYEHYCVSISGNSGPATLALSSFFVSQEQKEKLLRSATDSTYFLYELQSKIRVKFKNEFFRRLSQMEKKTKSGRQWNTEKGELGEFFRSTKKAISAYFQTVLYRYFFPFLTEKDIIRIYNGMKMFLNALISAQISPFSLNFLEEDIRDIIGSISATLLETLNSLRGVETFYCVDVRHDIREESDSTKDTHTIMSISDKLFNDHNDPVINCIFV